MAATSRQTRPWRLSVSYNERRRIGSCFSKTIVAIRSEKSISIIGFEKGKLLNLRCACHGRCLAHNRSISRNARSDTLDPCIKSSWLSIVQIQLPSFPFGCYTNPGFHAAAGDPSNLKLCQRGAWEARMLVETVLAMLTLVCHLKKVMHRGWAYFQARLAFTMAAFNVLVQWHGFQPTASGFVPLSIAEFSL
jgi:hypothetical protein